MAGAHGIKIETFHRNDFPAHMLPGDVATGGEGMFVAVHTAEDHAHAVQVDHTLLDFDAPESGSVRFAINFFAIRCAQRQDRGVELWKIRRPFFDRLEIVNECDTGFLMPGVRPAHIRFAFLLHNESSGRVE